MAVGGVGVATFVVPSTVSHIKPVAGGGGGATLPVTAGLGAWYDADDPASFTYSSGNVVSQWNDKSGLNRHLVQGTVAKQPTRSGTQNGHATVATAVGQFMVTAQLSTDFTTGFSLFVVYKKTGTVQTNEAIPLMLASSSSPFSGPIEGYNALRQLGCAGASNSGSTISVASQTSWNVLSATGAPASTYFEYKDGAQVGTFAITAPSWPLGNQFITLASRTTGTSTQFVGEVGEGIAYNRVLTTTERQTIEGYLKAKWGTP